MQAGIGTGQKPFASRKGSKRRAATFRGIPGVRVTDGIRCVSERGLCSKGEGKGLNLVNAEMGYFVLRQREARM